MTFSVAVVYVFILFFDFKVEKIVRPLSFMYSTRTYVRMYTRARILIVLNSV